MKRQILILPLLLVIVAGVAGGWYYYQNAVDASDAPMGVVRLGVDVPYPPYSFLNDSGELTGFEIDLGNATCRHLGIECEWVITPWDDIMPGLQEGRYDAIMSSMSINSDRAEKVDFGEAYYSTPSVLFTRETSGITSDSDSALEGHTVGVVSGYVQEDYLLDEYGDTIQLRPFDSNAALNEAIRSGEVDVAFMDYPIWEQSFMVEGNYPIIETPSNWGKASAWRFARRTTICASCLTGGWTP